MILVQSNILIVDDELFFRKLYRDLLLDENYQVTVCDNGVDAIRQIQNGRFDLVLTDMVMPGKDGLDILRAARAVPNPPDVILVTGHASLESAIDALKNGARDYLVKPFNPAELKHLVKTCLEQRRLLTENDHLRRQVQLFQNAQTLASLIDVDTLLPQALDILMRETGAMAGLVFVADSKNNNLTLKRYKGVSESEADALVQQSFSGLSLGRGFFKLARAARESLPGLKSLDGDVWMLPLGEDDALRGGIALCGVSTGLENSSTMPDLKYLCEQILLGFNNACRYQNAQQMMYTDDLTGLYNHRYMQVALSQEMSRSQRYGLEFSLLFFDLDHFKDINDHHGHLAGSAALKEVGTLLHGCVREVDTLFRFGGDEFAAILVETDAKSARLVAERIRQVIEKHAFLADRGIPSYVTVTAGYATYPTDANEMEELLELADQAMYAGKSVKNTICSVADIGGGE